MCVLGGGLKVSESESESQKGWRRQGGEEAGRKEMRRGRKCGGVVTMKENR